MLWYYVIGKEKAGPFNSDEFNELITNDAIKPETLVWNKTYEKWQRFETIGYQTPPHTEEAVIDHEENKTETESVTSDTAIEAIISDETHTENKTAELTGHPVSFSGSAGEYFKIWIVNLFLTILTLGIYAAWAKVRTKKYFYANTKLDGESFDYLADPVAILKGNLIVGGAFILFQITTATMPVLSIIILLSFFAAFPFLIYKSLCFNARNTSFRNIRFTFNGSLKESYKIFMLLPICFPLTMGLIAPYWNFRVKKYFYENFAFGSSKNKYTGTPGFFYETVFLAMGLMILLVIGLVIVGAAVGVAVSALQGGTSGDMRTMQRIMVPLIILFYIIAIALGTVLKTFVYVKLTNYSFDNTTIGDVKIKSNYLTKSLLWIRITNIPAILFSVGLLAPWAIIRTYRYMAENIVVFSDMAIDKFTASADSSVNALGESAADFFDMEIGL